PDTIRFVYCLVDAQYRVNPAQPIGVSGPIQGGFPIPRLDFKLQYYHQLMLAGIAYCPMDVVVACNGLPDLRFFTQLFDKPSAKAAITDYYPIDSVLSDIMEIIVYTVNIL